MVLQIFFIKDIVNESGQAVPVLKILIRQGNMPVKIVILFRKLVVLINVKQFTLIPTTVPEADLSICFDSLQLIKNVGAHWCHTGTTADEDHLCVSFLGEELTVRAKDRYLVARFQLEDIR